MDCGFLCPIIFSGFTFDCVIIIIKDLALPPQSKWLNRAVFVSERMDDEFDLPYLFGYHSVKKMV